MPIEGHASHVAISRRAALSAPYSTICIRIVPGLIAAQELHSSRPFPIEPSAHIAPPKNMATNPAPATMYGHVTRCSQMA